MKQLHYLPFLLVAPMLARELRPLPALATPAGIKSVEWAQIRAEYERHRHTAFPDGKGFTSRNRAQEWRAHFDERGFEIRPDGGKRWTFGLELVEFAGRPVSLAAKPIVEKNRVRYQRPLGIEEWFVNDARGLEQGFTIADKLGRAEMVLRVRGGLRPQGAGSAIRFVDGAGNGVMNYSGLKAWDANGNTLPSRMETAGDTVRLIVDDRGARYPIQIDPVVQQAFLKPAAVGSAQAGDNFGSSVSISGDTLVVGARGEDSSSTGINSIPNEAAADAGAAYVFVRSGGVWTQQAYLKPAAVGSSQVGDLFGAAVAIAGDTIVVGAFLEDSSSVGVNSTPNENARDAGAAYVFVRSGSTWTQQAYLKPAAVGNGQINDRFGFSVAISGDSVIVGAPNEGSDTLGVNSTPNDSGVNCGAAYVFVRSAGNWTQQAYLKPGGAGTTQNGDGFGISVAISGDTAVAGSPGESTAGSGLNPPQNENALLSGAAFVYVRAGTQWTQQAFLKADSIGTTAVQDIFGSSVALDGNLLVVGAPYEDSSTSGVGPLPNEIAQDRGATYAFVRTGSNWSQEAFIKPTSIAPIRYFGISAAISGGVAVFGSDFGNVAFTFVRNGAGVWAQDTILQNANPGNTQDGDAFGGSVSISGDTVVVGALGEDSSVTGVNGFANENAANAGGAFVYAGIGSAPAPLQFVPITPCRMVDTRNPAGALGGPALVPLTTRNFPIRAVCGVPSNSTAYSLNITVVPRGLLGFLTIWPGGVSQPLVSTLNSLDGRIKANAAVVPAGDDGSVNVFTTEAADVIIDVNGVFVPRGSNPNGQAFYSVAPCRIIDTRAPGGGGTLAANTTRSVIVANAGGCGIPSNATAYATNVTVVPKVPLGFLTLWTGGNNPRPTVSTLNALTGAITANLAIVPAGTAGDVNAFATDATELIVDITGYFAPPGGSNALNFYTLLPCRVVDTRLPDGPLGGPIPARDSTRNFPVLSSPCNVPSSARAYSMNATVVPSPTLGFLTLFPVGVSRPTVSTLNALDGSLTANAAIVPAGTSGQISAYFTDPAHLILDINGFFAP